MALPVVRFTVREMNGHRGERAPLLPQKNAEIIGRRFGYSGQ